MEGKTTVMGSDDYISDAVDALYAGDQQQAGFLLKEAMEAKLTDHFCNCLADVYGQQSAQ